MSFNRLIDRDIDALNPRTVSRHLVSGQLSVLSVKNFIFINMSLFVGATYLLNPLAFALSLPTLCVLMSYSLWKRFSWLCHLFLGVAIGLSPSGAWVAVRGELDMLPVLIGLVLCFWVAGFDIIYATQDAEVDIRLGLHSAPSKFGVPGSLRLAGMMHFGMLVALFFLASSRGWSAWAWVEICLLTLILAYIHIFRKSNSLDVMNKDFFLANAAISCIMMLSLSMEAFH